MLVANALEGDVRARAVGEGLDGCHGILFLRIDDNVSSALLGLCYAGPGHFENDDLARTGSLCSHDGAKAYGACAEHDHGEAKNASSHAHGLEACGQGLHECPCLVVHVVWQNVAELGRHVHKAREGSVVVQACEGQLLADIVATLAAGLADAAVLTGVGSHTVAYAHGGDALAHCHNVTRELVAQDDGAGLSGQRMRGGGNEDGSCEILVQVRAADATPGNLYLYPAWRGRRGKGNRFHTDVFRGMPHGSKHCFGHSFLLGAYLICKGMPRECTEYATQCICPDSIRDIFFTSILSYARHSVLPCFGTREKLPCSQKEQEFSQRRDFAGKMTVNTGKDMEKRPESVPKWNSFGPLSSFGAFGWKFQESWYLRILA